MAEAWGIPPWEAEDAPLLWVDRFQAWENAKAERQSKPKPQRGETLQVGSKQITRLI